MGHHLNCLLCVSGEKASSFCYPPFPASISGLKCLIFQHRTFVVGFNATSITSAAIEINERFGVSDARFPNSFWPVTSWGVGAALAPMVVLPVMEDFGMRIGYLVGPLKFKVKRPFL